LKLFFQIYFTVVLFLTIYQDFFMGIFIGEIGRGAIILSLPFIIGVELYFFYKKKGIVFTKLQKYFFLIIIYIFILGVLYCIFLYMKGSYVLLGENVFVKNLKMLTYYLIAFFYMRHIYFILLRLKSLENIFFPILIICGALVLINILESKSIPYAFSYFHINTDPYYRIRLLTPESSYTGTIAIVFYLLLLFITRKINNIIKRVIGTVISIIGLTVFVFTTGSKGFMIVTILSIILNQLFNLNTKSLSIRDILAVIISIFAFCVIFYSFKEDIISGFQNDLENFTSFSTRITAIFSGILIFLTNPFGIGYGPILYYYPLFLEKSIMLVNNFFLTNFNMKLNFFEVSNYFNADKNLSPKSGIVELIVHGGIFTIWYLSKIYVYLKKSVHNIYILSFINNFIWLALLTYILLAQKYELWFYFAFIDWLNRVNIENKGENNNEKIINCLS
jgi:hypothetical protein